MRGESRRQHERPGYAEAMERRCPVCGEALVIDLDEAAGHTEYRCPSGHGEDPLAETGASTSPRKQVGELGEDS